MGTVHPDLTALVGRRLAELGFDGRRLSYRQAEKRAKDAGWPLSPETIRQLHLGTHSGRIKDETVEGLRHALGVSRAEILAAMHEQRSAPLGVWQPPTAAQRLTLRQRRVVEELIHLLAETANESTGDRTATDGHRIVAVGTELPGVSASALLDEVTVRQEEIRQLIEAQVADMGRQEQQDQLHTGQ